MSFLKLAMPSHRVDHRDDCLIPTSQGLSGSVLEGQESWEGAQNSAYDSTASARHSFSFLPSCWQQVGFSKWAEPCAMVTLGGPSPTGVCGSALKVLQVAQGKPSWVPPLPWDLQECYVAKRHQGSPAFSPASPNSCDLSD